MNLNKMEELVRDAVNDVDLRPEDIPSIDLYLDQITSLAAEKRQEGSPRFYDRELTKTMVNNYSKDGLIAPIKGKKYSKDHILQMLLVYSMKNTLSIGEIKRVLQNTYELSEYDSRFLGDVYTRFLVLKELERSKMWDDIKLLLDKESLDTENEKDFLTLILGLSAMSSYLKNIVQALIEEHYLYEDERKDLEKRERKEAATRLKEEKKEEKKEKKEEKRAEKQAAKQVADEEEHTDGAS